MSLLDRWRRFKVKHFIGSWWVDVYRLNTKHGYRWEKGRWHA